MSGDNYQDHALAAGPDLATDEERERFVVDNDEKAMWAMRKLAAAEAEMGRIGHVYGLEQARLDRWQEDALAPLQRDHGFFRRLLIDYRMRLEVDNPKLGAYKLPTGSIVRRKGRERVEVPDEETFTAWAEQNAPDALLVRRSVSRKTLADWPHKEIDGHVRVVSPDGEVVPGVEVVRGPDHVDVKVAEEGVGF